MNFLPILLIAGAAVFAARQSKSKKKSVPKEAEGGANPASIYCGQQGGRIELRTSEGGGQYGVCVFPDGKEVEEWAFFRGEANPK